MSYIPTTGDERAEMLRVCGAIRGGSLRGHSAAFPTPFLLLTGREIGARDPRPVRKTGGAELLSPDQLPGRRLLLLFHSRRGRCPRVTKRVLYRLHPLPAGDPRGRFRRSTSTRADLPADRPRCLNASLYDGGTALFEACQMAMHATGRRKVVIDGGVNPIYRKMLYSYTANLAIEFVEIPVSMARATRPRVRRAGRPDRRRDRPEPELLRRDRRPWRHRAEGALPRIMAIQSVYPIALALLKTPGERGRHRNR